MRCASVLLAASIAWTAPAFAQSTDENGEAGWQVQAPEQLFQHAVPLASQSAPASSPEFMERERRCLATAIYFEGHYWSLRGQIAIGQVILNRVRSPRFPQTICGVVYQGQRSPDCQFHFACDGRSDIPDENDTEWALAQSVAKKITAGELWLPEVGYATSLKDPHVATLAPHALPEPPSPKAEKVIASGTETSVGVDWLDRCHRFYRPRLCRDS
jgi:hypothetical protein